MWFDQGHGLMYKQSQGEERSYLICCREKVSFEIKERGGLKYKKEMGGGVRLFLIEMISFK